jgi:hypothetical protein
MGFDFRKILRALTLSGGVLGFGGAAHAVNFTMVPASAGTHWSNSDDINLYRYQVTPHGSIINTGSNSFPWWIPVPNSTSHTGGAAWIDLGPGTASGFGFAIDEFGNWEATTNVVYANANAPTDQMVTFSAGFQKTGFTYVTYVVALGHNDIVFGVEYEEF